MKDFINKGRKIIAYGFNYMNHAKELSDAIPKYPFFFLKPTSSYLANKGSIEVPKGCEVHYEIELGVIIGKDGRDIPASKAEDYVAGYALAIDMTARNMQNDVRAKGLPWSASKGFDTFTPIGEFIPKANLIDPHKARIWLKVNEQTKQDESTEDMVYK
ncbi:hypothetical protein CONCODRAFT_39208 [Conidiobolus coronatus NRRL 28638]|uniref:Fumarylacetoacetase-like C-terminal domain-containing protein n=1 Tax=Conidiobolus coronatus (strain ATCC 28846 / CBS 209.66 / NRRL 28638) TaxID=796925 RepID=A0A137P6L0_CONC2|nr:hypothetical protein CONCODRAFT_39208 [Conidiobolus coronatus NRRL 28638]|eukprot:KXN70642.1 hypothetical protein CONCODRAFT_39208 [Conidiobolus coronatus NRRL 28638]